MTRINYWAQNQTVVPTVGFGISGTLAGDATAFGAFSSLQPTVSQQAAAAALYATLVGRINAITANVRLDEETGSMSISGDLITRTQLTEYGFFAQDTWRFRPNLTLTGGLRWEVQGPFQPLNDSLSRLESFDSIYGESGAGNLFMPGTLTGAPTRFVQFSQGEKTFDTEYGNFAPSVGISWSPNTGSEWFHAQAAWKLGPDCSSRWFLGGLRPRRYECLHQPFQLQSRRNVVGQPEHRRNAVPA